MITLPLILKNGHLFVELAGNLWLFDTGAPTSFGESTALMLDEQPFTISKSYLGLSASTLSEFVGIPCYGLLGTDVVGQFDHLLNSVNETLTISKTELKHSGRELSLSEFMGIPIVTAQIAGQNYRMFFDTGAQISYFQNDSLKQFPADGVVTDFYPGFGEFQTSTHQVEVSLGDKRFTLRCGALPHLLGMTLMMADTQGIIGNQVLANRLIGFFPRRRALCL